MLNGGDCLGRPTETFIYIMKTPYLKHRVCNTDYRSHTFGVRVKFAMMKEAAQKDCCFILPNIQINQTVSRMAILAFVKIIIKSEESWTT